MKVTFISRTLQTGGAERQLSALAAGLTSTGDDVCVTLFHDDISPANGAALEEAGVRIRIAQPTTLIRRGLPGRTDVIYGFGPGPNVVALLAGKRQRVPVVFGVRNSNLDARRFNRTGRWVLSAEARLARNADLVIANSEAGRTWARRFGDRIEVVENGIDVQHFRPRPDSGLELRSSWGIAEDELVLGIVGHIRPVKGHAQLLRALSLVDLRQPWRLVIAGAGDADHVQELKRLATRLDVDASLIWVEEQQDIVPVYSALDGLCLPSFNEGFPNVVAEAMACGVPCLVTDVGAAARIVDDAGVVVPAVSPRSLATGIEGLATRLFSEGADLREMCRERIAARFGIGTMVERTHQLLHEVASS